MNVNFTDEECICLPRLDELKPGDLFERDCDKPMTVYMVVDPNRRQRGKYSDKPEYITRRQDHSFDRSQERQVRRGFIPYYIIDVKFNRFMPGDHFKGTDRVRRLCGELNVSRES